MASDSNELKAKGQALAIDVAKQFLTLALGGIAFAVGITTQDSAAVSERLFWWTITVFGLSALCGFGFLLHAISRYAQSSNLTLYVGAARWVPSIQIGMLVIGTGLLLWLHVEIVSKKPKEPPIALLMIAKLELIATNLSSNELQEFTSLAIRELATDLAQDDTQLKARNVEEWLESTNSSTPPDELKNRAILIRPYVKNALTRAAFLSKLSAEKLKSLNNLTPSITSKLVGGGPNDLSGEIAKEGFRSFRKKLADHLGDQRVSVACNCGSQGSNLVTVAFRTDESKIWDETQWQQIWKARALLLDGQTERRIILRPFTDTTGEDAHNAALRRLRIEAVRAALIHVGIPPNLIGEDRVDIPALPIPSAKGIPIPANRVVVMEIRAS